MGAGFNKEAYKAIYQHPTWEPTADRYEVEFAANLYKAPYVKQAASTALTRLSRMLNAYYGSKKGNDGENALQDAGAIAQVAGDMTGQRVEITDILQEALLPRGDSSRGAGQIGSYTAALDSLNIDNGILRRMAQDRDRDNLDQVINGDGNLREKMTLLYNGMFINGGKNKEEIQNSRSLKNMLVNIDEDSQSASEELGGVSLNLLGEMRQRKKKGDIFDTYYIARDLKRKEDKLEGKGSSFGRYLSGVWRGMKAAFSSTFTRRTKRPEERQGLGLEYYQQLGLDLSDRERSNALIGDQLRWQEGTAWYEMKQRVNADGMLQTAGPSGSTLRMLGAYKLMGASFKELMEFRLALIAWMVTSKDHSLYEILVGSHNAGVKGGEDLTEPATMYMTVDPLPVDVLRQEFAPQHQFPHEMVYKTMLNELRDERAVKTIDRNVEAMQDPKVQDKVQDNDYLKDHLQELKDALAGLREKRKGVSQKLNNGPNNIRKNTIGLANQLARKGVIGQDFANECRRASNEDIIDRGIYEYLAGMAKGGDSEDETKAKNLMLMASEYLSAKNGVESIDRIDQDIKVFEEQQKYVQGLLDSHREQLFSMGFDTAEGNNFTLYGKSYSGVMKNIGDDAMNADAQDIALNIYTTGAYLAMTRSQKYLAAFGKRALSDERVNQSWKTGFGSYEYSSSLEMQDKETADRIFQMIQISSRMAQDALVERGQTVIDEQDQEAEPAAENPAAQEEAQPQGRRRRGGNAAGTNAEQQQPEQISLAGKQAYMGVTYRGGRLTGGFQASRGTRTTIGSMMSSSKFISKAAEYYLKSRDKNGDDNSVLIEYEMTGKGSVDISGVSKVQKEGEVLIPASTTFAIVDEVRRAPIRQDGIHWEEVEPDDSRDESGAQNEAAAGNERRDRFPIYGKVVRLREVDGPGSRKRNEEGREAQLRRDVRSIYQRSMRERMRRAAGGR
ncbi:MAG: hypothetical protein LUE87_03770 [Lachnospiraceae bacterium]|nr:hypothetical protein [Lachnospiraceae bacterium]